MHLVGGRAGQGGDQGHPSPGCGVFGAKMLLYRKNQDELGELGSRWFVRALHKSSELTWTAGQVLTAPPGPGCLAP